jgi:thiamine kinase-like enzyme
MKFFPVIELVDRYSIACLKYEKTQANKEELDFYKQHLASYDIISISKEIDELYNIHKQIWELESQLKSGKENEIPLEEIGRRAIAIRDLNNKRIKLKNLAAEKLNCPVREIKQDHLSS